MAGCCCRRCASMNHEAMNSSESNLSKMGIWIPPEEFGFCWVLLVDMFVWQQGPLFLDNHDCMIADYWSTNKLLINGR